MEHRSGGCSTGQLFVRHSGREHILAWLAAKLISLKRIELTTLDTFHPRIRGHDVAGVVLPELEEIGPALSLRSQDAFGSPCGQVIIRSMCVIFRNCDGTILEWDNLEKLLMWRAFKVACHHGQSLVEPPIATVPPLTTKFIGDQGQVEPRPGPGQGNVVKPLFLLSALLRSLSPWRRRCHRCTTHDGRVHDTRESHRS